MLNPEQLDGLLSLIPDYVQVVGESCEPEVLESFVWRGFRSFAPPRLGVQQRDLPAGAPVEFIQRLRAAIPHVHRHGSTRYALARWRP